MRLALLGIAVVLLVSCRGEDPLTAGNAPSTGASTTTTTTTTTTQLTPAAVAKLGATSVELPLRRLSRTQFVNTLHDLVERFLPLDGKALAVTVPAMVDTARFPADEIIALDSAAHGGYLRADQRLTQAHIDAQYTSATMVANALTATPARMTQLMGACATDADATNDTTCLRAFVQRFGRAALRAPLTGADIDFFAAVASTKPVAADAVADVITLMLASPQFIYLVETGQANLTSAAGEATPLAAPELAARLSYHFWQTLPDDELNALADSGALLKPATYAQQVQRLVADARADASVREFFSQWFRLQELAAFDARVGDPVFDAFAGSFKPKADSHLNANAEITDMVSYLAAHDGTLQSVLTDRHMFAKTADIASLYGSPPWNGTSAPANITDATRTGLLTRVAFTASGSANTRPIMKGLRVRTALLCQSIPPPPPAAMGVTVNLSTNLTTREVIEQLTQAEGSLCSACHTTALNPLGFITENFDGLGRPRTSQALYDATGKLVASKAVNTQAVVRAVTGDARSANDAGDATKYILDSGEYERCFAQQYFRYTFSRLDAAPDAGVLTDLQAYAKAGQPLRTVLATVAMRPEFQRKDFR